MRISDWSSDVCSSDLEAVAAAHGPVDILHFDAHPDLYDDFEGDPRSHASPFARIMEGGHARRLVQVGIRTLNRHCREQDERFGVEIVPMRGIAPERVPRLSGAVYIRSEEHTSELQSLTSNSYAVFR